MSDDPLFSVRLITDADCASIAKRWKAQYCDYKIEGWADGRAPLRATSLDAVDAEIGNNSWTHITCESCGEQVRNAVVFNRYGSETQICAECATIIGALGKAIRR